MSGERVMLIARFPEINTIDAFNIDYDPARKKLRDRYLALHDLDFLAKGVNPIFIGTPGTGKTFLARALAYKACLATRRVDFALFMVEALENDELVHQAPAIVGRQAPSELAHAAGE